MKKYTKVIVTGGAGFIGSHLVEKLVELGYRVTVVDDFSRGSRSNLSRVKNNIKIRELDLRKEEGLLDYFKGHKLVFNLAALNTGIDYDLGKTQKMFEENMLLQMIPLKVAAQTKSIKKFIQVSSASVYSRRAMDEQAPTLETANTCQPEKSKLGYALAKKMGENLARWYGENSHLETTISRLINVYGERDNFDDNAHFIAIMIRKFIEAKNEVQVFGSGRQKRSFLYVNDAVSSLLLLAKKGRNGEVYNVDAGEEHSVREVVNLISSLTSREKININYDTSKPEGSQRRLLDSTKLRNLGWTPEIDFQEGLKRTIEDIQQRLKVR